MERGMTRYRKQVDWVEERSPGQLTSLVVTSPLAAIRTFNAAVLPLSAARWMALSPCKSISESMFEYKVVSRTFQTVYFKVILKRLFHLHDSCLLAY